MSIASGVTAPGALPFLGHAPAFVRDKLGFLLACHRRCGDRARLDIGGPTWLLNDPEDVKHVLVDAADRYDKTPKLTSPRGRMLSGSGLLTSSGARHLTLRRMVQPLFHRRAVEAHARHVEAVAEGCLSRWRTGSTLDMHAEMLRLAEQVMLRALFGEGFADPGGRFAQAVIDRRAYVEHVFTSNLPAPERWPLPVVRRYRVARAVMADVIAEEIARRRGGGAGDDWLSLLARAEGRDGERMSDAQLHDEAVTLTSTGYETVAASMSWTLHLLSLHPEAQDRARAEAMAGTAPAEGRPRPFVERAFDEALRLYPPSWLVVRVALAPDELPGGARVAVGDKIYLAPYTMHRHPAWWPDPERFDPGRFTEAAAQDRPRFAFFPFGGGLRQCIGEPFARLEAGIVLRAVLRWFRLVPAREGVLWLRPSVVLEPRGGLPMRVLDAGTLRA